MSSTDIDIPTIISIISGVLLTLSETLPFLTNLKSNGILEVLINVLKKKFAVTNVHIGSDQNEVIINVDETKIDILIEKLNKILNIESKRETDIDTKLDVLIKHFNTI